MAPELRYYVVLYWEPVHAPADPPFAFVCQADDADHAEEQCIDAEGRGTEIAWVWEGTSTWGGSENIEAAYDDYWNLNGDG